MTLQFRSRITSAIDYTKELTSYGVCCEHDMSPTAPNDPTPKNTFKQYKSTANKCYSDQNSESYITRTFYPNVDLGQISCETAADLGCCCSCRHAKQSNPNDYREFLEDSNLLPFDTVKGEDKKCDINEYDIEIALHPEVGMRDGVPQCECARIGGVWKSGKCPRIEPTEEQPDEVFDPEMPFYNWYWDEDTQSWVSRPELGTNSKTQLIKTHCYKKELLTSTGSVTDPPPDPKGTCCISPIVYGDWKYCHSEAVTQIECQELADPTSEAGQQYIGRNGDYEWQASPNNETTDCSVCLAEPVIGVCCPDSTNQFYGNPFKCVAGVEASLYETEFGVGSAHPCAGYAGNPPSGISYDYIESAKSCQACPKKGLCCNDTSGTCLGLKFRSDCADPFRWVEITDEQIYNQECGDNTCDFPTGRCCVVNPDRTASCYDDVTKYQCEVEGISGGPTGSWTQDQTCGTDAEQTCGVGLCCDYENNICSGGQTVATCSGPNKVLHVDKTGAECESVCHFNKGWCCSEDEFDTNNDGSNDIICHGYVTKNTCDNIRATNRFTFTSFNNRDDENEGCQIGCPGSTNSVSICCQDSDTPSDGLYETCIEPTIPGDQVTELECLFVKNGPDANGDYTFTPRTNRQWYPNADTCGICDAQTSGLCCNYVNNTCVSTTEAQCTDPAAGGNANNEWAISGGCPSCNFEGMCCYVEVGLQGELIPKCEDDVKRIQCETVKKGVWSLQGECANNGCGWGICCNQFGTGNVSSCQLSRNGKLAGWNNGSNPGLVCVGGNFKPFTPEEITAAGNWPTEYQFIDGNVVGPAEKICSSINAFALDFNWFTTPIPNNTLIECRTCNRLCEYQGRFCKDLYCASGGCGPLSPGCECLYNTYDYYETVSNLRCGSSWQLGNQGCQECNTTAPSWSLQAIYQGGDGQLQEGEDVTIKLTGTGLNPTLGAFGITYTITGNISSADFNASTPPNNGTFNFTGNGAERSSQFNLTTIADFLTEGDETFKVKTLVSTALDVVILDTSRAADYKLETLDSTDTITTDFDLDERTDTFRKLKFTYGTNPPPTGTTYSWTISGTNVTTGDFVGLPALTGVFTLTNANSFIETQNLTINKDKITEGPESFTFTVNRLGSGFNAGLPISQSFNIADTAPAPSYNLTRTATFITEGLNDRIQFDFKVQNEDPGTTYSWVISGTNISASDLNLTGTGGVFTLSNGDYTSWTESVGFTGATGDGIEGTEGFTFSVYRLGSLVASLSGNEIRETSQLALDFSINSNPAYSATALSTAQEGSTVRTRLKTLNVPDGVTFPFKLFGPGVTQSDINGPLWDGSGFTGMFTIIGPPVGGVTGYAVSAVNLLADYVTDGGETFHVYLQPGPNLTTYGGGFGLTSANFTIDDWFKDPRIEYSFTPSSTTSPDNSRALSEDYHPSYPRGFTLTMKTFNWNVSGKTLTANITSWPTSNVTPTDFGGVWRTATSSSSSIGTNTNYLGMFDQIYGNTLIGITLLGPTGVYISANPNSGSDGNTGLIQYFFEIRKDATTDLDPCGANPYEGFTFSVPNGQTLARLYAGPAILTGVTSNFIIYETSPAPITANFNVYENDEPLTGSNPTTTEDDTIKIEYVVRNICDNKQLAVQIGTAGDVIDVDDIDFNSSSITANDFTGCFDFTIDGTFALGTASNPIILVFNRDDNEGTESLNVNVYRNPCSAYFNSATSQYNFISQERLSTLSIGIGDGAPLEPRGACCNANSPNPCRSCTNGCVESECLPGEVFTTVWYERMGVPCPYSSGQPYNCNNPPPEEFCSACCGKKKVWCCNPVDGNATENCVTASGYSCPAGQYEVDEQSDCVQKVTCCNDFNNTCTTANKTPGCIGAFERTLPYSSECSVCNFNDVDPDCNLGAKYNYNVSWPVPKDNGVNFVENRFESGQYPGPILIDGGVIQNTITNMIDYLCSTGVCCEGDGEGCVKKVYDWNVTSGAKTTSGCESAPDYNQHPLFGENGQFYSACAYAATKNWNPTTDLDEEPTTAQEFYEKYIYNIVSSNWTPYKCSNCSYGVCCKLDVNNGNRECLGSRVSRNWCKAKESLSTDSTKVIRWISSYHQCKTVNTVSADGKSLEPTPLTIPSYDCEICDDIVDLDYLYPGAWNTRDYWPGTLPKNTHVTACINCKPEGDPSGGAPSGTFQGGGHDSLYERFSDYFNLNANTTASQSFMKYRSLPDNFSSAKYTLDQNSTAETCCKSYSEDVNAPATFSNFRIDSASKTTVATCICTNPDCICNFTDLETCANYDYDLCCDGCKGDPLGRCCDPVKGTCSEKSQGACSDAGGIGWVAGEACGTPNPCERGACCEGGLIAGGIDDVSTCTEVARFECQSPDTFNRGQSCPEACGGTGRPKGACCQYGKCTGYVFEEDCISVAQQNPDPYVQWNGTRTCDVVDCSGTRPVACCRGLDKGCSIESQQQCTSAGGVVQTPPGQEATCVGINCPRTVFRCNGCPEGCVATVITTAPGAGDYTNINLCINNCSNCVNCIGGVCIPNQYKGTYSSQQACENSCGTSFNCNSGTCQEIPGQNGEFDTLQECRNSCGFSFNCINNTCTQVQGQNGTYTTQQQCQASGCGSTSYNCVNNLCVGVPGIGGQYSTLTECRSTCGSSIYCRSGSCVSDVGLNGYPDISACNNVCGTSVDCINSTCTIVTGQNGQFDNISQCQSQCGSSYNCVSGTCQQVSGNGGQYSTLSLCQSSCVAPPTNGACCSWSSNGTLTCFTATEPQCAAASAFGPTTWSAGKNCNEVNCVGDSCCCSDEEGCIICFTPLGKAPCFNCFDSDGDPLTRRLRTDCEGP